ncbi:MAG: DNA gyrase inhibitor YacG [Betaproteobacteria bacterium]|nr:DNA gyrase inhibitor YacG [Betaproteobacteria bacterium]
MTGNAGKTPPPRLVKCPACGRDVPWLPQSRYRPFCSERCRNTDLGAWASGAYRIPQSGPSEDGEEWESKREG